MAERISPSENLRQIRLPGVGITALPVNTIHSSRFTTLTVVPKSLLEQFNRFSNIWFLVVSIFQLAFSEVSVSSGWDTLVPLAVMLLFTLAKDCYLLYRQQAYDEAVNKKTVSVWTGTQFEAREAGQILVGQIVAITAGETSPADVLILTSSSLDGLCYVDSAHITGDRSLAVKKPVRETSLILKYTSLSEAAQLIPKLQGEFSVSQPDPDFQSFAGKVKLKGFPTASRVTTSNLLLQGAEIRSVQWVLGLVVYTGPETKSRLNGARQTRKTTALERKVNRFVLLLLPILLIPALLSAILSSFAARRSEESSNFFDKFVNFCLLYNNIIPISLFVSLDIVRLLQGVSLRRAQSGARVNNPDISEELGQVEYAVIGKNGTLTEAEVRLTTVIVDDKEYTVAGKTQDSETTVQEYKKQGSQSVLDDSHVVFRKGREEEVLERSLCDEKSDLDISEYLHDMAKSEKHFRLLQAIMTCHCLVNSEAGVIGSAEELGLVAEARRFGFQFLRREKNSLVANIGEGECKLRLLGFTTNFHQSRPTRVLIQRPSDSFALLFTKGPGSVLKEVLNIGYEDLEQLQEKEEKLQRSGLRTILLGVKEIPQSQLEAFEKEFCLATRSLFNTEDRVDTLFRKYEEGATLLGLLGIEEKLVPGARETVDELQKAGVTPWLVSADSELSTITTAFNVKVYPKETQVVAFHNKTDAVELAVLMTKAAKQMILGESQPLLSRSGTLVLDCKLRDNFSSPSIHRLQAFERQNSTSHAILRKATMKIKDDFCDELPLSSLTSDFSLSIDGKSLDTALADAECRQLLVALLFAAKGVSFNRLLPLQKAQVVRILRQQFAFRPVVLAVGSGDADIPMLTAANVGVQTGAKSPTGQLSDVSLESLDGLRHVVLVYGRWNLMRLAKVVLLFIYKNVLLTLFLMAYNFFCDFQLPGLFPQGLVASYNVLFTTFPVLAIGVWDEDLPQRAIATHPLIYQYGIQGKFLTFRGFALYFLLAIGQTFIILLTIAPELSHILRAPGQTECFDVIGTLLFLIIVATVLMQVTFLCAAITVVYCLSVFVCLVVLYAYIFISNWMDWNDAYHILEFVYVGEMCLLRLILSPVASAVFAYAAFTFIRLFFPTVSDLLQQLPTQFGGIVPWSRAAQYESDVKKVYKSSSKLEKVDQIDTSKLHPLTLKFSSKYLEKAYQLVYYRELLPVFRVVSAVLICLLISWLVYTSLVSVNTEITTSQALMIATLGLVLLATKLQAFEKWYKSITVASVFSAISVKFLMELLFRRIGGLSSSLIPLATFGLLNVDFLANSGLNLFSAVLIAISLTLNFALWSNADEPHIELINTLQFVVIISGIAVTYAVLGYYTSKLDRLHFQLLSSIESQAEKLRSILCCFLPEFVRERVRRGVRYIAEEKGVVTVLFCDICDFDAICASLTPVELTAFLDELFQKFDSACEVNGVFKVETVGKTYMACAGLKESEKSQPLEIYQRSHACRAIELAFHILRIVQKYRMASGAQVQVKIGINSGPVVAGVVGFHKPQFSLVGDTVNTASRMCSTIEISNTIQISEATYLIVEEKRGIKFDEHIISGVKGKGDMKAFFVTEKPLSFTEEDDPSSVGSHRRPSLAHKNSSTDVSTSTTPKYERIQTSLPSEAKTVGRMCFGTSEERDFRVAVLRDTLPVIRCGLVTAAVVRVLIVALRAVAYEHESKVASDECLIAYSFSAGFTSILALTVKRFHQCRWFPLTVWGLCTITSLLLLADFVFRTDYFPDLIALEMMYGTMVLTTCSGLPLRWTIVGSAASVALWVAVSPLAKDIAFHFANLTFIVGFAAISVYASAAQERKVRRNRTLKQYSEKEIQQTEDLLSHMLPPHVYESLKQEKNVTEHFSGVTILFADIVGFTSWSSAKTPSEVVTMLSELFTRFDKLCVTNLVYKVHTIGDCYVAMGYAGESAVRDIAQECRNIVNLAFDMVKVIQEINEENGSSLNMRIGIHTGEVIAGITGTNVVRYDIYGPDVLIANKMESNGQAGKVNVSDRTKSLVEENDSEFLFTFNREVEAKSIGRKHDSFFVTAPDRKLRDKTARSINSEVQVLTTKAKVDTAEDIEFITLPA